MRVVTSLAARSLNKYNYTNIRWRYVDVVYCNKDLKITVSEFLLGLINHLIQVNLSNGEVISIFSGGLQFANEVGQEARRC
jgi:hypothetical protein